MITSVHFSYQFLKLKTPASFLTLMIDKQNILPLEPNAKSPELLEARSANDKLDLLSRAKEKGLFSTRKGNVQFYHPLYTRSFLFHPTSATLTLCQSANNSILHL